MMEPILDLKGISKQYSGVMALENIDLAIQKGKIHSIVGENGAGKSTLIKIITGAVKPTTGSVFFRGSEVHETNPRKSLEMGISAVYQEFNLISELKIYENIFYGRELKKGLTLDAELMKQRSDEVLKKIGMNMDTEIKLKYLGIGSRQTIEIAKALIQESEVVLFDEPTASLTQEEVNNLHRIIKNLRDSGIAVIYVSHKLDEVFEISDTITVLRDGKHIRTTQLEKENYTVDMVIEDMIGREILSTSQDSNHSVNKEDIVLELKNVSTGSVNNIDLCLHKGEILSISGLLGSKRTELLNAIFGVDKIEEGEIFVKGRQVSIKNPVEAIKLGIGYVSEDRKDTGLFMDLPIRENASIVSLKKFLKKITIDKKREKLQVGEVLFQLKVKYSSLSQKIKELSGGNQQKIAIGKWLLEDLDIIMLDEPTRGVDVGAKEEINRIIFELVREGKAVLLVSSEADEIIKLSDRTLVMSSGRIVSEYSRGNITSEKILRDSARYADSKGVDHV